MLDGRPVSHADIAHDRLVSAFLRASDRDQILRWFVIIALARRPPVGFFCDFVVEYSGARKGLLDIKNGGLLPIVDLAHWAAGTAGVAATSTAAWLDAAEAAGTLEADAAVPQLWRSHIVGPLH
jgi:CBS domain-containing protein